MKRLLTFVVLAVLCCLAVVPAAFAAGPYQPPEGALAPVPLNGGAQAGFDNLKYKAGDPIRIAYMPPATEFNYY